MASTYRSVLGRQGARQAQTIFIASRAALTSVNEPLTWRLPRLPASAKVSGRMRPGRCPEMLRACHRERVARLSCIAAGFLCLLVLAVRTLSAEDGAAAPTPPLPAAVAAAIRQGDAARLDALLQDAALVNSRDAAGNTPLILAALYGDLASVELLLEKGADANAANQVGVTPLLRAATDAHKVE